MAYRNDIPQLGDLAKDTITNFTGTVVAKTEWMNGCIRLTLQPQKLDKDGKPIEAQTFDIQQLATVKVANKEAPSVRPGGPKPGPARRPSPSRR